MNRRWLIASVGVAAAGGIVAVRGRLRLERVLKMAALASRGGVRAAAQAPRIFLAAGEQRQQLRNDLALQTAEDVTRTLGNMKGVLMKLGQMLSYTDSSVSPTLRASLARLQDGAPPMAPEMASSVIQREFGVPPSELFAEWDPLPIAAASIGQVHRAVTQDGRAVAVKIQYPDVARTMEADLNNATLLKRAMGRVFKGLDTDALIGELRARLLEELDYSREAENQRRFAACYAGHPTIHIPAVVDELSTARVLTTELVVASRFADAVTWSAEQRDAAAETIFRFVFQSLYEHRMFNADPHPGNYLFGKDGRVTFLDFGMVKHFEDLDIAALLECVRCMVVDHDPEAFRSAAVKAGFLRADAPVETATVVDSFCIFYDTVMGEQPKRITTDYASQVLRRFLDAKNPLSAYINVPPPYIVLQRINVGLLAVMGELDATANWRAIADEIWPFADAPPSTAIGRAEVAWRASRRPTQGSTAETLNP